MRNPTDLRNYYKGILHVHSRFSHDGRDSIGELSRRLKKDGIDFCVLADHFEDFNAARFEKYLAEVEAANRSRETMLIPGIEAGFHDIHVILFPVSSFAAVRSILCSSTLPDAGLFRILAHPAKYALTDAAVFLRTNNVDGLEIWNQQADGNYLPPVHYFRDLLSLLPGEMPALFFGTDTHNVKHRINNLLLIPRDESLLTSRFVLEKLRQKAFVNYHRVSAQSLPGNCTRKTINDWLHEAEQGQPLRASVLLTVRRILRFHYHLLPRPARHLVNDLKNSVKSRL